jgi:hypothetical protein
MLYYNGLSKYGDEKFKPQAEDFSLFKNMNRLRLLDINHVTIYDKKAFGDRKVYSQPGDDLIYG